MSAQEETCAKFMELLLELNCLAGDLAKGDDLELTILVGGNRKQIQHFRANLLTGLRPSDMEPTGTAANVICKLMGTTIAIAPVKP